MTSRTSAESTARPRVAVIGGGFTGAVFAANLARKAGRPLDITIVEPRPLLGGGVAYSTPDPTHRINVPATRMTVFADDEGSFDRWLRASGELERDPAALDGPHAYPRRAVFGRYMAAVLAAAATGGTTIAHRRDLAVSAVRSGEGWRIALRGGEAVEADLLVLATSHPPPTPPAVIARGLAGHPRLIVNPWQAGVLDAVGVLDDVVIVGTALTMADIVASLEARGHRGHVLAVSRRGLTSRGHARTDHDPIGDFATAPSRTVRELVRRVRGDVARAAAQGIGWQPVLDAVRRDAQPIWRALPLAERRRLLRHIRPFWDIHRYRIAPQQEAAIARARREGRLEILAAAILDAAVEGDRIVLTLRPRRAGPLARRRIAAAALIVATGPDHGRLVADNPVLASLAGQGRLRPDSLALGVDVDERGRVVGAAGETDPSLLAAGPLARATWGELMGLPQVSAHAAAVADEAAAFLRRREAAAVHAPAKAAG